MPPILVILAIWAAGLGASAQFAKLAVGFDALAEIYTGAGALLGFAVSLLSLLGLIFGLSGGKLVSRIGPKRALVGGLVLAAAMSAVQALLPPLPVFLIARTIEGLSHLILVVAAPTLIAEIAPLRLRPAAMTLWSTFFSVAFAVLAWIGPGIIAGYGLDGLLWAHAIYALLMAALMQALLPKPARITRPAPQDGKMPGLLAQHVALYRDPFVSAAGWGWIFYTFTFVSILTLLPELSPDPPAWLPALLPLAAIASSLTLGVALLSRFSAVTVSIAGFGLSALACLGVLLGQGSAASVLGLFLCLGLVQAAGFALVPELNSDPVDRAMGNGAIAQTGNLGNLTGTPILLILLSWGGAPAATLALVLCYVAGFAAHVIHARRRARWGQDASASRAT